MQNIVITGAVRTPIGTFGGALATVPASELGSAAIGEALARSGVDPGDVVEVLMGQIEVRPTVLLVPCTA